MRATLNGNIGKPKELWKTLKSLGLLSKTNSPSNMRLKKDDDLSFDSKINAKSFKNLFSNLASDFA